MKKCLVKSEDSLPKILKKMKSKFWKNFLDKNKYKILNQFNKVGEIFI